MQPQRRRATSAANGITLVSLALGSRSRSSSRAERDILTREGKRHEREYAQKGLSNNLGSIVE